MKIEERGRSPDGEPVLQYTFARGHVEATCLSYGASLRSLRVPDRHGEAGDIVLGLGSLEAYCGDQPHFGATIGRFANRIARSRFRLGGDEIRLVPNEGEHQLHGGPQGLGRRVWHGEPFEEGKEIGVRFRVTSPDGDQGYPGKLEVSATYRLRPDGELVLEQRATTDRSTVVNLTNHAYFHLGDAGATRVFDHRVQVAADAVLEIDDEGIPTGGICDVAGTVLDLRAPVRVGDAVPALEARGGFDHCFVLRGPGPAARVAEPVSGRTLTLETSQPGLQLYTGNFLDGRLAGPGGIAYGRWHALCLEPQGFPDAPNHPAFPSARLEPGDEYAHTTVLRFGVEEGRA